MLLEHVGFFSTVFQTKYTVYNALYRINCIQLKMYTERDVSIIYMLVEILQF